MIQKGKINRTTYSPYRKKTRATKQKMSRTDGTNNRKKTSVRPAALGAQKHKNEQISVGQFCGKGAMVAKKNGNGPQHICRSVFFFLTTYGNDVITVGGTNNTQTYGTVPAFRRIVQDLPLRTR